MECGVPASGRTVTYTHDTSGRIDQITSVGNNGSETLADTIARLPFGPVSSLTLGNGIQRTRTYDQDYRVESLTDGSVFAKGLAYSAVNNITAITDNVDSTLSQLFTYDDLDRLDFATGNYGEDTYSYDGIGNRLSFTRDTQTESYQYGSNTHRLQSVAGQSYQYDAAGNTLSGGGRNYTYNDRNRLVSATANGTTTDYQHNALGQRVVKGSGADQTHYVYDLEGRLIAEAQDGTVTVEYAYLDGEPLVMWRESGNAPPTTPPIKPVLISPISREDVSTASPTFVWEQDPLASEYRFRVYDRTETAWIYDETFDSTTLCAAGSCSITPPITLSHNNNHLWRVRGQNVVGIGAWSDYGRFDYPMATPGQVTLVSPIGSVSSATLDYVWQPDAASTEYRVRIYDRIDKVWIYDETHDSSAVCTASTCSVTPTLEIDFSKRYLWRARGQNATGVGA